MTYCRNNLLPAVIWLGLSFYIKDFRLDPLSLFFWLRTIVVFGCFLIRWPSMRMTSFGTRAMVWISALLPTFMRWELTWETSDVPGLVVCITGTTLVIISCVDLGRSFGISPAVRMYVSEGIYRRIKHPMYLGHIFTEIGILMVTPSFRNLAIAIIGWVFYLWRIRKENEFFVQESQAFCRTWMTI